MINAGPEHASLLAALHEICFAEQRRFQGGKSRSESWSAASIARLLALPRAFALIANGPIKKCPNDDGAPYQSEPSGFIMCTPSGDVSEIVAFGTIPEFRRCGLGRLLLNAAQAFAIKAGFNSLLLEVAEDNDPAIALYQTVGFQVFGSRKNYYLRESGRINAIQMHMILSR